MKSFLKKSFSPVMLLSLGLLATSCSTPPPPPISGSDSTTEIAPSEEIEEAESVSDDPSEEIEEAESVSDDPSEEIEEAESVSDDPSEEIEEAESVSDDPSEEIEEAESVSDDPSEEIEEAESVSDDPSEEIEEAESVSDDPSEEIEEAESVSDDPSEEIEEAESVSDDPSEEIEEAESVSDDPSEEIEEAESVSDDPSEEIEEAESVSDDPSAWRTFLDSLGEDLGMLLVLLLVSLVALISVAVNFYLYRWRRILSGQPHLLMPEEYVGSMERLTGRIDELSSQLHQNVPLIYSEIQKASRDLLEAFLGLQKDLEDKNQEIKRLKHGYDLGIFHRFLLPFVELDVGLGEFLEEEHATSEDTRKELLGTQEMLWETLEECGVEKFSPELGENYAKSEGVADHPKMIPTKSEEEAGKISRVLTESYRVRVADGRYEYIKLAKVEVMRFDQSTQE